MNPEVDNLRTVCAAQPSVMLPLRIRELASPSASLGMTVKEIYTLADLKNWRKKTPIRLGVFGDPVEHSLSPQIQNAALETCKIQMQYARFQITANELEEALQLIRTLDFVGVNLTVPHKIAAYRIRGRTRRERQTHRRDQHDQDREGQTSWLQHRWPGFRARDSRRSSRSICAICE